MEFDFICELEKIGCDLKVFDPGLLHVALSKIGVTKGT